MFHAKRFEFVTIGPNVQDLVAHVCVYTHTQKYFYLILKFNIYRLSWKLTKLIFSLIIKYFLLINFFNNKQARKNFKIHFLWGVILLSFLYTRIVVKDHFVRPISLFRHARSNLITYFNERVPLLFSNLSQTQESRLSWINPT